MCVVSEEKRVFELHRPDGSLVEDLVEVHSMFNDHFQAIFSPYPLSDGVLVA